MLSRLINKAEESFIEGGPFSFMLACMILPVIVAVLLNFLILGEFTIASEIEFKTKLSAIVTERQAETQNLRINMRDYFIGGAVVHHTDIEEADRLFSKWLASHHYKP